MIITFVYPNAELAIPGWVQDIQTFRRWYHSDEFPQEGHIWWLKGEVWVDMTREQIFTHVLVKTKFAMVLGRLVEEGNLGLFLTDGVLLSNFAADISGVPDSLFVSTETLQSDRIRLLEGAEGGFTEQQGSPDLVLEIVSRSSVNKDTTVLKRAYWEAGVREYWLVDARQEPLRFDVFRHTARGYVATPKKDGWVKSSVLGQSFQLTQCAGSGGHPDYRLQVRE